MEEHAVGRSAVGPQAVLILVCLAFAGGCGSGGGGSVDLTTERTAHSVELSWTASTSSNAAGYNVYRSTSPDGPFTRINSAPVLETQYTDTTVVSGMTYYYAATSVNLNGQESARSGVVQVELP